MKANYILLKNIILITRLVVNWILYYIVVLKIARERSFILLHIDQLTTKIYSHQRYVNISYYLKSHIPKCHRQTFRVISQTRDYVDSFCNYSFISFSFCITEMDQSIKLKIV